MKIGIIVPFSWSYWGGVVEHAEQQAEALRRRGHEVKTVMGHDPPGRFTRLLHPRTGRHGNLPPDVISVGRSVVVPANGSLPNIILSPRSVRRIRDTLDGERFDVVHLHEPMTPAVCVATLALARCPIVTTHHAHGDLSWLRIGVPIWGFLLDRVDARIAVSRMAAQSAERWLPGEYRVIPNGVLMPEETTAEDRDDTVVFIGRHDPRKGLPTLLRAWPEIHRRTGARLRVIGTDPLQFRFLHSRLRVSDAGIDVLGIVTNDVRTHELERAKLLVTPALGGESFGLVLAEAFACATPAVASDIPGYADVVTADAARLVPPSEPAALAGAVVDVLSDEPRRVEMGRAAHAHALAKFSWEDVSRRLEEVYEEVTA
jgi:phosphatidylinositol alpha-mannosyltransferase